MQPCNRMAKLSLLSTFYKSFKMSKLSSSEFGTMYMWRGMQACEDEFLAMVTEGVVCGVYKVMNQ